jgi:hypothetical protein
MRVVRKGGGRGEEIRGDGLGGHAEPRVVCEADVVVVEVEDGVALVPVSGIWGENVDMVYHGG